MIGGKSVTHATGSLSNPTKDDSASSQKMVGKIARVYLVNSIRENDLVFRRSRCCCYCYNALFSLAVAYGAETDDALGVVGCCCCYCYYLLFSLTVVVIVVVIVVTYFYP